MQKSNRTPLVSIEEWLKEKLLYCKSMDYPMNEKESGEYVAQKLIIFKDKIRPVGAWIIGASGRIDLIGDFDQQILIYLKENTKLATNEKKAERSDRGYSFYRGFEGEGWYWIEEKRLGNIYPVNKKLFLELLTEVTDYDF
jgi:hypothetical protein